MTVKFQYQPFKLFCVRISKTLSEKFLCTHLEKRPMVGIGISNFFVHESQKHYWEKFLHASQKRPTVGIGITGGELQQIYFRKRKWQACRTIPSLFFHVFFFSFFSFNIDRSENEKAHRSCFILFLIFNTSKQIQV